ncbi:hypothetical protein L484_024035 [Morus notabilis]|uniref:Uncharacterized protein n=1 Tax=Morus notabilis TaxID=981085 RepID=W9S0D9_9ROSA|nr:hypothetical protein L484_024035 [Morus notabilis]
MHFEPKHEARSEGPIESKSPALGDPFDPDQTCSSVSLVPQYFVAGKEGTSLPFAPRGKEDSSLFE